MTTTSNLFDPGKKIPKLAHVAIVLDRSGSMEECRDATINGFNEYVHNIRRVVKQEELAARITLTVFNHSLRTPLFQELLSRLHALDRVTYVPHGATAMLDAVGRTMERLEQKGQNIDEASVLVCIISDGYENASRKYTRSDVAERIQRLTATGRWTFTYLGSNQDLSKVASDLAIPIHNTSAYASDPAGTAAAWERHARASTRRMQEASRGDCSASDFYRETIE
jgi:von Willebrand factor type A domain